MSLITSTRLRTAIAAVCPIVSVAVVDEAAHITRLDFDVAATPAQKTAANNAVAAFDWSASADASFIAQQASAAAVASVDNGIAKSGTQFERLCMAVVLVALDATNLERAALTAMNAAVQGATTLADVKSGFAAITFPPQVTMQQLQTAVKNKLGTFPT